MSTPAKRTPSEEQSALLRKLPSVDELLLRPAIAGLLSGMGRRYVVEIVRETLAEMRREIASGEIQGGDDLGAARVEAVRGKAGEQRIMAGIGCCNENTHGGLALAARPRRPQGERKGGCAGEESNQRDRCMMRSVCRSEPSRKG